MRALPVRVGVAIVAAAIFAKPAAAAGTLNTRLDDAFRLLADVAADDELRIRARDLIRSTLTFRANAVIPRLIQLGRKTKSDNVRMHIAILLASAPDGPKVLPPAFPLLTEWLNSKNGDSGMRYWAARAIANLQDEKALEVLKAYILDTKNPIHTRRVLVRDLAQWPEPLLRSKIVPLLLTLLKSTAAPAVPPKPEKDLGPAELRQRRKAEEERIEFRTAIIDALGLTGLDEELVVEPLLEVARKDPDERIWRAATAALRKVGGGVLFIPPLAPEKERLDKINVWEKIWRRKHKRRAPKTAEATS